MHLSGDQIALIKRAFITAQRSYNAQRRKLLFQRIPLEYFESLDSNFESNSEQLGSDLATLNATGQLEGGIVPLKIWLENARDDVFAGRDESNVFQQTLEEMARNPAQPPDIGPPTGVIRKLREIIERNETARDAIFKFRLTFSRAHKEMDITIDYKGMHDQLHNLQLSWPDDIGEDARKFDDPALLRADDLQDPAGLALKIRDGQDPLSLYLRPQFSPEARQQLDSFDHSGPPPESLQKTLVEELNRVLGGPSIFSEELFDRERLRAEVRSALDQGTQGSELARLNRWLLQEGYPREIVRKKQDLPALRKFASWLKLFESVTQNLQDILDKKSVDGKERVWIEDLDRHKQQLQQAFRGSDGVQFEIVYNSVKGKLTLQLSYLNDRLKDTVEKLNLKLLVEALQGACDVLVGVDAQQISEKVLEYRTKAVQEYKNRIQELNAFDDRLRSLKDQHNDWQFVDIQLQVFDRTLGTYESIGKSLTPVLEIIHMNISTMIEPRYKDNAADWAKNLRDYAAEIKAELDAKDEARAVECFRNYRTEARYHFFDLDAELKKQCDELKKVNEQLRKVDEELEKM